MQQSGLLENQAKRHFHSTPVMKPNPVAFKVAPAEMMQQETHVSTAYPGGQSHGCGNQKLPFWCKKAQEACTHSSSSQPGPGPGAGALLIKESERLARTQQAAAQLV